MRFISGRRARATLAATTAVVLAGVAGWSAIGSAAPPDSIAPIEGTVPPGTYRIGYQGPSSGPAAVAGVPLLDGVRFAVDEINETGFLGPDVTLELVEEDDGADPALAIANWDSLMSEDVSAVICCALSSQAGALKPKILAGEVPAIISSAILPGLPERPTLFRPVLLLADPAYDQLIGRYVEANPDASTVILGVTGDSDGMVADGEVWATAVSDHGLELVDTISTNTGDTDFAGPATQVIDANPDVFIANMLSNESTLMIKALRERGYTGDILATYGLSSQGNYEVGGESLDGVVFPQAFSTMSTVPMAQQLTANYEAATGNPADVYVAQGYNAVYFIANGMKAAESGESADIAEGLASIQFLDTVYGPVEFDETGQAHLLGDAIFLQWNADGTQSLWEP